MTPFIEIPTSRNEFNATQGGDGDGETTGNATSASIGGGGGSSVQNVLNNTGTNQRDKIGHAVTPVDYRGHYVLKKRLRGIKYTTCKAKTFV